MPHAKIPRHGHDRRFHGPGFHGSHAHGCGADNDQSHVAVRVDAERLERRPRRRRSGPAQRSDRNLPAFQVLPRLHARAAHQIEEHALEVVRQHLHRQAAHRGKKSRARAVHVVDVLAADNRAHRQLAAQHAELQIDPFFPVKPSLDAVYQRRDADTFTGVSNENFFLSVSALLCIDRYNERYGGDK